jgi:hypothetical protein
MDSAQVHKIIKARQYAQEPERIHVRGLEVEMDGDDRSHHVELHDGVWRCDCEYFHARSECAHTMALERVIGDLFHAPA